MNPKYLWGYKNKLTFVFLSKENIFIAIKKICFECQIGLQLYLNSLFIPSFIVYSKTNKLFRYECPIQKTYTLVKWHACDSSMELEGTKIIQKIYTGVIYHLPPSLIKKELNKFEFKLE